MLAAESHQMLVPKAPPRGSEQPVRPCYSHERRLARSHFTKILSRIGERLDASGGRVKVKASDPWRLFAVEKLRRSIAIQSIWIFGSYARGAADCADLDLIVRFQDITEISGPPPYAGRVLRAVAGSLPGVSIYKGTPTDNQSGVDVSSEARLFWSAQRPDWRGALGSIQEDPAAGHFARKSDLLPLSPGQLRNGVECVDEMVAANEAGELVWHALELERKNLPDYEVELNEPSYDRFGKQTVEALRSFLLASEHEPWREPGAVLERPDSEYSLFKLCGSLLHVGKPVVWRGILDSPAHERVILIPHLTARGPSRAWVIERGPNHKLRKLLENRIIYGKVRGAALVDEHEFNERGHDVRVVTLMRAPSKSKQAWRGADRFEIIPEGASVRARIAPVSVDALLARIARAGDLRFFECGDAPEERFRIGEGYSAMRFSAAAEIFERFRPVRGCQAAQSEVFD